MRAGKDRHTKIRKEVAVGLGLTLTLGMQKALMIFKRRGEARSQRKKETSIIDLLLRISPNAQISFLCPHSQIIEF